METRLGLKSLDSKPERASPLSIDDAARRLADEARRPLDRCAEALKHALLAFSLPEKDRGVAEGAPEPLFAFKLHQFISGAGRLYTTLDPSGSRTVTFDGQRFDPTNPEKRLFATHFCRKCWQELHPVTLMVAEGAKRFEKREIDDIPANGDDDAHDETSKWGFLMPEPVDGAFEFGGRDEDYPELLARGNGRRRPAPQADLSQEQGGAFYGPAGWQVRSWRHLGGLMIIEAALLWVMVTAPADCSKGCKPPTAGSRYRSLRACEKSKVGMIQHMLKYNAYQRPPAIPRAACVYRGGKYPLWRLGRRPQPWKVLEREEQARKAAPPVLKEPPRLIIRRGKEIDS